MPKLHWIALALALVPWPAAHAAAAAALAPPARLGLCAACHGEDGRARIPGAPHLAGQPYAYLLGALRQYRSGQRDVAVMRAALGPLGERELEGLARWYAAQAPCPPTAKPGRPE